MLLYHLCIKYQLEPSQFSHISNYVNNRDEYINDIMKIYNKTKDEAKTLIISTTYGAEINLDKLKWFNDYKKEINFLIHIFI